MQEMGRKTSGGRLFCADRSEAETLNLGVRGVLPQEMGRKTSSGRLLCADRSEAETLNPGVRGVLPQEMGRKTSGGRLFCADRSEAETLNLGFRVFPALKREEPRQLTLSRLFSFQCRRWDLNPHDKSCHKILSLARLPVPTLLHNGYLRSVGVTGFEPATSWSQTRRSSQAEPHPVKFLTVFLKTSVII